jgi:hypothetical protein
MIAAAEPEADDAPAITDPAELHALFAEPALAGRRACRHRARAHARRILIRQAPPHTSSAPATVLRGPTAHDLDDALPDLSLGTSIHPGDRLIVRVDQGDLLAYCAWLVTAARRLPPATSLAPYSPRPGGLLRLHLIAAARLALPLSIRVEARHDLLGVRLAQVALDFGADTLAGPIDAGRHLPLAGVPRPSETSRDALAMLIRQAGLDPEMEPA